MHNRYGHPIVFGLIVFNLIFFAYVKESRAYTRTPSGSSVESPVTFTFTAAELTNCSSSNWKTQWIDMTTTTGREWMLASTTGTSQTMACGDTAYELNSGLTRAIECPSTNLTVRTACTTNPVGTVSSQYSNALLVAADAFQMTSSTEEEPSASSDEVTVEAVERVIMVFLVSLIASFIVWRR